MCKFLCFQRSIGSGTKTSYNYYIPKVGQLHAICIILIFHLRLKLSPVLVATVIVIGLSPSKSTYMCCPKFSPQILGTIDEPPVMLM